MTYIDTSDLLVRLSQATRRWAETEELDAALHDIVYTCCEVVPCHAAAIALTSTVPANHLVSLRAASNPDEFAVLLHVMARAGASPGLQAAATLTTVHCPDLSRETSGPLREFAAETVQRTAVRATIAYALQLRGRLVGVLNVYFAEPGDLDPLAQERADAIADHVSVVFGAREQEQRAGNLEVALRNSRTIGAAIGILVERHKITRDAAFAMLRAASQRRNRKLSMIAEELLATGSLA